MPVLLYLPLLYHDKLDTQCPAYHFLQNNGQKSWYFDPCGLDDVLLNGGFRYPPHPAIPHGLQYPAVQQVIQRVFSDFQSLTGFIHREDVIITLQHRHISLSHIWGNRGVPVPGGNSHTGIPLFSRPVCVCFGGSHPSQ